MAIPLLAVNLFFLLVSSTLAADCLQKRQSGINQAAGSEEAAKLRAKSFIANVCQDPFVQLPNNTIPVIWRPEKADDLVLRISRDATDIEMTNCNGAIEQIIDQCIENGEFEGGSWSFQGETYEIYNEKIPGFPGNDNPNSPPPDDDPNSGDPDNGDPDPQDPENGDMDPDDPDNDKSLPPIIPIPIPIPDPLPGPVDPPSPPGPPDVPDDDDECITVTVDECARACTPIVDLADHDKTLATACDLPYCTSATGCSKIETTMTTFSSSLVSATEVEIDLFPVATEPPAEALASLQPYFDAIYTSMGLGSGGGSNIPETGDGSGCSDAVMNNWPDGDTGEPRSLPDVPSGFDAYASFNELVKALSTNICDNECEAPLGIDDKFVAIVTESGCHISVGIDSTYEAFCGRTTYSEEGTAPGQGCQVAMSGIIDTCSSTGAKNGWTNSTSDGQLYLCGYRSLNLAFPPHDAIDEYIVPDHRPRPELPPPPPPPQTPPEPKPITPDLNDEMKCFSGYEQSGASGADVINRLTVPWINAIDSSRVWDSGTPSDCLRGGETIDSNGEVKSHWCVLLETEGVAIVLADKDQHWGGGAPGHSQVDGTALKDLSYRATGACSTGFSNAVAIMGPGTSQGQSLSSVCFLSSEHPEQCNVNFGVHP